MDRIAPAALLWTAAYLVGAIPFGYLVARARGVDIRAHGSGNIGATNVGRVLGRKWGLLVFLLDAGKGLAVMMATQIVAARRGLFYPGETAAWLLLGSGLAVIVGNVAPVYLRFRGGKAVATSVGVTLGVWPDMAVAGLLALGLWLAVLRVSRYVSLASIAAAGAFPLLMLATVLLTHGRPAEVYPLLILSGLLAVIVIARHRANIGRLWAGTEQKIGMKSER